MQRYFTLAVLFKFYFLEIWILKVFSCSVVTVFRAISQAELLFCCSRVNFMLPFQPLCFNLLYKSSFNTTSLFPSHCWYLSSSSHWRVITHSKRLPYNFSDVIKNLKTPANKRFINKTYPGPLLSYRLTAALDRKVRAVLKRLKLQRINIQTFKVYMIFLYFSTWYQTARLDSREKNWVITVHSSPVHKCPQTGIEVHSTLNWDISNYC